MSAGGKESKRKVRLDPRAEPMDDASDRPREEHIQLEAARIPKRREAPVALAATLESASPSREQSSGGAQSVVVVDPRYNEIEPLMATASWAEITKKLGTFEQAGKLPPPLGLLYAIAAVEAAGDQGATAATPLAIRSVASIFSLPADSRIALVVAKRLLRRNPAAWRTKPAPSTRISVVIMVIALAIGAAVGWYLSNGRLKPW